jgi:hypothetical protein
MKTLNNFIVSKPSSVSLTLIDWHQQVSQSLMLRNEKSVIPKILRFPVFPFENISHTALNDLVNFA